MAGKAYQSKLNPYYNLIRDMRLARKTWREIAEEITAKGCHCTIKEVHAFFKRKATKNLPLGFTATTTTPSNQELQTTAPKEEETTKRENETWYDPEKPITFNNK